MPVLEPAERGTGFKKLLPGVRIVDRVLLPAARAVVRAVRWAEDRPSARLRGTALSKAALRLGNALETYGTLAFLCRSIWTLFSRQPHSSCVSSHRVSSWPPLRISVATDDRSKSSTRSLGMQTKFRHSGPPQTSLTT